MLAVTLFSLTLQSWSLQSGVTMTAGSVTLQARPRSAPVTMCAATAAEAFKAELLEQLSPIDRGFKATIAQRRSVNELLKKLAGCDSPRGMPIDGDWELAYTDAPDILTLNGGPLATLSRIGQQIDEGEKTIANVLEYRPASWLASLASDITKDSLQQRILLTYEVDGSRCDRAHPAARPSRDLARPLPPAARYNLKILGAGFNAQRLAGIDVSAAPPLRLQGPLAAPFGQFELLYNDGTLRVIRTQQGYFSVNRRLDPEDGWGPGA